MLILDHVTKFYHDVAAVKNVSFTVPEGCVSVLVGPNARAKYTFQEI